MLNLCSLTRGQCLLSLHFVQIYCFCVLHFFYAYWKLVVSSHIDDLKIFLSLLSNKADIICISERRLSRKNLETTNLNISGYNTEHTPTDASAGGTLMYISKNSCINYKKTSKYTYQRNLSQLSPKLYFLTKKTLYLPLSINTHLWNHTNLMVASLNLFRQKLKKRAKWQCWQEISTST